MRMVLALLSLLLGFSTLSLILYEMVTKSQPLLLKHNPLVFSAFALALIVYGVQQLFYPPNR